MLRQQDVGHRVVVRRIVGVTGERTLFTDALGELVDLTETDLTLSTDKGTVRVPLREARTLHHDVIGRHGAGKVVLRAAVPGTGIIAGGPMRAVFETLGINDIVAKSTGTTNPYNMVRATFDALKQVDSPRSVAARRGLKVSDLQARRGQEAVEA